MTALNRSNEAPGETTGEVANEAEFVASCRRITHGLPQLRLQAIRELVGYGSKSIPALARALTDSEASVRHSAGCALGRIGTPGVVDPLCKALKSDDELLCIIALRALGEVADVRAIPPMAETLRLCLTRRNTRGRLRLVMLVLPPACLFLLLITLTPGTSWFVKLILPLTTAIKCWLSFSEERRTQGETCAAAAESLAKIAAAQPEADLRYLVPDLRLIAGELLLHNKLARMAAREAAVRIDSMSASGRDLPVPATSPELKGTALPLTSQEAEPLVPSHPRDLPAE